MRRFFVPDIEGDSIELPDDVLRHLSVLRLVDGSEVVLFDGTGTECLTRLVGTRATVMTRTRRASFAQSLTLLLALPKGGKIEDIIRMVTELGVDEIRPVITERTIARPTGDRIDKQVQRWQKIASEAAQQCERSKVPVVYAPERLLDACRLAPDNSERLVCWARGGLALQQLDGASATSTWVAVGPEGGFSDAELASLDRLQFTRISLGQNILRVDTAAIAVVAQLGARRSEDT